MPKDWRVLRWTSTIPAGIEHTVQSVWSGMFSKTSSGKEEEALNLSHPLHERHGSKMLEVCFYLQNTFFFKFTVKVVLNIMGINWRFPFF